MQSYTTREEWLQAALVLMFEMVFGFEEVSSLLRLSNWLSWVEDRQGDTGASIRCKHQCRWHYGGVHQSTSG